MGTAPHSAWSGRSPLLVASNPALRAATGPAGVGDPPGEGAPRAPLPWGGRRTPFLALQSHLPAPGAPRASLLKSRKQKPQDFEIIKFNHTEGKLIGIFRTNTFLYPHYPLDGPPWSKKLSLKTRQQLPLPGPTFHILPYVLKNRIQPIQGKRTHKKEPEDMSITSRAVMRDWHLE